MHRLSHEKHWNTFHNDQAKSQFSKSGLSPFLIGKNSNSGDLAVCRYNVVDLVRFPVYENLQTWERPIQWISEEMLPCNLLLQIFWTLPKPNAKTVFINVRIFSVDK